MNCENMTRKEFDAVPMRESWSTPIMCKSIVLLPGRSRDMHDSGFRCMDFVAINQDGEPICRLSEGSDVVHIDGIGGMGENWLGKGFPMTISCHGWTIDCLAKSGLLRLFCGSRDIKCAEALSSFSIYATTSNGIET